MKRISSKQLCGILLCLSAVFATAGFAASQVGHINSNLDLQAQMRKLQQDIDELNSTLQTSWNDKLVDPTFYSMSGPFDFVISNVNGYFCLQNGTTGLLAGYNPRVTVVEQWAIGNLTRGTIYLKGIQYDGSLTIPAGVLIVQEYDGTINYWNNTGLVSLVGPQGLQGPQGIPGIAGVNGANGANGASSAVQPYGFLIYYNSTTGQYMAQNGISGQVVNSLSSTNASYVLNTAASLTKSLFITDGTYWLDSPLNLPSNIAVQGASEFGTVLKVSPNILSNCIQAIHQSNITISYLTVNSNLPNNPQHGSAGSSSELLQNGVSIQFCINVWVKNVYGTEAGWNNFQITNSTGVHIRNCFAQNAGWKGIEFWDNDTWCDAEGNQVKTVGLGSAGTVQVGIALEDVDPTPGCSYDLVSDNIIENCSMGIYLGTSAANNPNQCAYFNTVTGNTIWANTANGYGIYVRGNLYQSAITGNTVNETASGSVGFYAQGSILECTISHNVFYCAADGIRINGNFPTGVNCTENNIEGNIIQRIGSAGGTGVIFTYANNSNVFGNQIIGFSTGLSIASTVTCTVLQGNRFTICTTPVSDSGTNTSIINNMGYNPIGYIANSISSSGTTIVDSGSGSMWTSGKTYTNWESPKALYVSGGTEVTVQVDGNTVFNSLSGFETIVLQPGDTFTPSWAIEPSIIVFGQ